MQTQRTLLVNGIELFVREQGQGPLVVLCHGWPELSFSWRHQIGALAAAGFHVVAPDMRGFGRSSAPADISAYSIMYLVGDVVGLVNVLGAPRAAVVGHDWGAPVAWHAAQFRPDLFCGVAGLSVPPWRGKTRPLEALRQAGITNFYWQYFQQPGVAEAELERDVALTMRAILSGGFTDPAKSLFVREGGGFIGKISPDRPLPDWLSEEELAEFVATYRATGFRGGLNWYRNIDRNWELTAPWSGAPIRQPSLFIAGAADPVISDAMSGRQLAAMDKVLPGLTRKLIIPDAGHWIQQERPAEVNAALIEFLKKLEF